MQEEEEMQSSIRQLRLISICPNIEFQRRKILKMPSDLSRSTDGFVKAQRRNQFDATLLVKIKCFQ